MICAYDKVYLDKARTALAVETLHCWQEGPGWRLLMRFWTNLESTMKE